MKRREFLKMTGALAGTGMGFGLGRLAWSAPFGEFPGSAAGSILPQASRAKNILEVFLYGGLSCWESLYYVPTYGQANGQQYYTFGGPGKTGADSVAAAISSCGISGPNGMGGTGDGQLFAKDASQTDVYLGPFAYPLWNRSDVTARMRMLVMRHELEPHEAAVPLALTGKRVGLPSLAGLGAHIQRYFVDRPDPARKSPYSYVFATGGLPGDNVSTAALPGMHPGIARPLLIKMDNASGLTTLLQRGAVGTPSEKAEYDALLQSYVAQYRQKLVLGGAGNPLRAARFENLSSAVGSVSNSDALLTVMDPAYFNSFSSASCGDSNTDIPGMSLNLAVHLLTHPTEPAKYVCVSDTGIFEASGGGGYDTHTTNSHDTARNFNNVLTNLLSRINGPAENDPAKLNLDDTMIILNTEFGRTPTSQSGDGRNHHPYGYVQTFIGGPITASQKGIAGAIGSDGSASTFLTPSEARIGALLAMGIWPFAQEAFFVSDVQAQTTELDAVKSVTLRALGYSV